MSVPDQPSISFQSEQVSSPCVYCKKPLESAAEHVSCRASAQCIFCGLPELCQKCSVSECGNVMHLHCLQRRYEAQLPSPVFCDVHQKRTGKVKEYAKLMLARQVAQRISLEEETLNEINSHHMEPKTHNGCTGNVFWFIICHQFFPNGVDASSLPLDFCVKYPPFETDWESVDSVREELQTVKASNEALWTEIETALAVPRFSDIIPGKPPRPSKEHEHLLAEIKQHGLRPEHEKFLEHLESQVKRINENAAAPSKKTANMRGVVQSEEDFFCSVCGDGDYEDDDLIVICSKCEMGAHMNCYGIPQIPEHDWFCEACLNFPVLEERHRVRCALCSVQGGAVKKSTHFTSETRAWPNYPFAGQPEPIWCHVFCALHLHHEAIRDPVHMTDICFDVIDTKRFNMKCQVCHTKDGACLQCQHRKCQAAFHPECGKDLFVNTRDKTGYDEVRIYCTAHKPLNLRRVLDSKEKRTAEEIVSFARLVEGLEKKKHKRRTLRRRRATAVCTYSYRDKFAIFELAEQYLEEHLRQQRRTFTLQLKRGGGSLRHKVDVQIPPRYTLLDPQAIFSKRIKFQKKKTEELYQFYLQEVYPVMKSELALLREPVIPYKPSITGAKRRKQFKTGRKRAKLAGNFLMDIASDLHGVESEEVYCICRRPFVSQAFPLVYETEDEFRQRTLSNKMIGCDGCDEWYHLSCLGLPLEFEGINWLCPNCQTQTNNS